MNNITLFPSVFFILSTLLISILGICFGRYLSQKLISVEKKMDTSNYAGGFEPLARSSSFYSEKFFLSLLMYLVAIVLFVILLPWILDVKKYGISGWNVVFFEFISFFVSFSFVMKKRKADL